MKRVIGVILLTVLILIPFSALAGGITVNDKVISLTVSASHIPLTVNAVAYPITADENNLSNADIAGINTVTFNTRGEHIVTVKLKNSLRAGKYCLKVNTSNGAVQRYEFDYVSAAETSAALALLNSATEVNVISIVMDNSFALGVSDILAGPEYQVLSLEGKDIVLKGLIGQNFANAAAVSTKLTALIAARKLLEANLADGLAQLNSASADAMDAWIAQYADVFALDVSTPYGYHYLLDSASGYLSNVYTALVNGNFTQASQVKTVFDDKVMIAVLNQATYSQLKDVIAAYAGELADVDLSVFEDLHIEDEQRVLRALAGEYTFETAEQFADAWLSEIQDIPSAESGNKPPRSSSGGGGGGGSVTIPIIVPPVPAVQPVSPVNPAFNDTDSVLWAVEAINALKDKSILSGYGDGAFLPNNPITRAEFTKVLILSFGLLDANAQSDFMDVDKGGWSYAYISSAYKAGIISGVSESRFAEDDYLTREQMALMIYRAAGGDRQPAVNDGFMDIVSLNAHSQKAIYYLKEIAVVSGVGDGRFEPERYASRAEIAKIVFEVTKALGEINR